MERGESLTPTPHTRAQPTKGYGKPVTFTISKVEFQLYTSLLFRVGQQRSNTATLLALLEEVHTAALFVRIEQSCCRVAVFGAGHVFFRIQLPWAW